MSTTGRPSKDLSRVVFAVGLAASQAAPIGFVSAGVSGRAVTTAARAKFVEPEGAVESEAAA